MEIKAPTKDEIKQGLTEAFQAGSEGIVKAGSKGYKLIDEILEEMAEAKYNLNLAYAKQDEKEISACKTELSSLEVSLKLRYATIKTELGTEAGKVAIAVLKTIGKTLLSMAFSIIL